MKKIRKLICSIIGHNYINLYRNNLDVKRSVSTGWKCQRCGEYNMEQWDT